MEAKGEHTELEYGQLLWREYQSLEATYRVTLPLQEFCELRGTRNIQRLRKHKPPRPKFDVPKFNGRNDGMLNFFINYSWSPVGMKEDITSLKVVDSKRDDPKCVSCAMAIDTIVCKTESPILLEICATVLDFYAPLFSNSVHSP
eukprot:Gb_27334 [translate_table: standard]